MQDIYPTNTPQFDEGLRLISACPVCRHVYGPHEATLIDERDASHLMYLKCRECQAAIVALVMASQVGLSSVGIMTDLTSTEIQRVSSQSQIVTEDDVLAVVAAIRDSSGQFLD